MRSMRASSISARCNVCICASSRAERSPATANSRRCRSAASAAFRFAWRWILAVCHIDTRATQNTTAPKNHSALDPIWPGLRTMYQAMERQAATPQISQPIPRQPPNGPSRRGAGRTCAGSGVGSVSGLTSPRSDGSRSLVDCASPVILASHLPEPPTTRVQVQQRLCVPPTPGWWHAPPRSHHQTAGLTRRATLRPAFTSHHCWGSSFEVYETRHGRLLSSVIACSGAAGESPCRRCSSQRD